MLIKTPLHFYIYKQVLSNFKCNFNLFIRLLNRLILPYLLNLCLNTVDQDYQKYPNN